MDKSVQAHLRLKQFVEENIPVDELMSMGFFGKGKKMLKKTDYKGIAKSVCRYFGYQSIYQYQRINYDPTKMWNKLPDGNTSPEPMKWNPLHVDELELKTLEKHLN